MYACLLYNFAFKRQIRREIRGAVKGRVRETVEGFLMNIVVTHAVCKVSAAHYFAFFNHIP